MSGIIIDFFAPAALVPQGYCYLWELPLVWLHLVSDSLIGLAYYFILIMLICFVYKRRNIPFQGIILTFGVFIISGTNHMMEVWTLWHPSYWLSGSLKALTAIVSLCTAATLFRLIPQALALPSQAQLEIANQQLKIEIAERQQVLKALQESEARFRSIFEGAAIGIELLDITGKTVAMNPALQRMLGYAENELQTTFFKSSEASLTDSEARKQKQISDKIEKRYLDKSTGLLWHQDYYQMERRYLSKHGQLLWGHLTASVVRDTEGKPQFIIRMVEDITERKQALKELQQYKDHLEDLVKERTAELSKVNEKLLWQASHDPLTGLINRREFEKRLDEAVSAAKNEHQIYTLCYIDLDRFKIVNDSCGHAAGDELLRQVSTLFKSQIRKTDVFARLGGDEFSLLLCGCSQEQAIPILQKLQDSIQAFRFVWEEKPFSIGASIGMISIDAETSCLGSVLSKADAACYAAKNTGRNRIYVYRDEDTDETQQSDRGQWIARITQALETPSHPNNQFCLYYQPIVPLNKQGTKADSSANSEHYEILLRLIDGTGKAIPPMAFFPIADRSNLMPAIDRWVILTFFSLLGQQDRQIVGNRLYSINLSAASLKDPQFITFLEEQFATQNVSPQSICFELTETVAIANLSKAVTLIQRIKALGCRSALDDFGSSMSSLAYLKHLPVDYLKIDGILIKEVATDPIATVMVESINRLAHLIGMETIAEFVSDTLTLQQVKAIGLHYAQGYALAEPQPLVLSGTSLSLTS